MANTPLIPIFPAPPRPPPGGWTQDYGNQLDRWLRNVTDTLAAFNYGKFSGMMLAATFPSTPEGLKTGEVFTNINILTVVRLNDAWIWPGVSITGSVGTITVSV